MVLCTPGPLAFPGSRHPLGRGRCVTIPRESLPRSNHVLSEADVQLHRRSDLARHQPRSADAFDEVLAELQRVGLVRHIGVRGNVMPTRIAAARRNLRTEPLQPWAPARRCADGTLLPVAASRMCHSSRLAGSARYSRSHCPTLFSLQICLPNARRPPLPIRNAAALAL